MSPEDSAPRMQVAVGVSRSRDRELLSSLLSAHEVVHVEDAVPEGTDMCVLDDATYGRLGAAIEEWQERQPRVFTPVMLLSEAENPWQRYAQDRRSTIDDIVEIPTPPPAIEDRIEALLETRRYATELDIESQLTERIFKTSPLMKVVFDTEERIVRANDRFADVFGVDAEAVIGRSVDELGVTIVDEGGDEIRTDGWLGRQVLDTGDAVYGAEYGLDPPSGDRIWVTVNAGPIRDELGEVEYVVLSMIDVTDRRAQTAELERQLDLFQKAEDIAKVGAWEYTVENEELWWSDEVARIHGTEDGETPSVEEAFAFYHPEDRPRLEACFERAVERGEPYELELRITDADGVERWVRTRGEPQFEDGEVVRVRGTIQEITDRKERETELRQMTRAVDAAPIGVVVTDPTREDNPLTYVNQGFLSVTGYDREDVLGRNCRFLQGEETAEATVAELRRAVDAEEPISTVIRNYRADGTAFWNQLEIAPIRDESGAVVNFIGFQQDVTERVQSRRQFQMLDRYLRHNLRNKMNVILGMTRQIEETAGPPVSEYAREIAETSERLLGNVDKEREITKLLNEDPIREEYPLDGVLDAALDGVRSEYPAAAIRLDCPPEVRVRATKRLSSALAELARNAIEHTEDGPGRLAVTVRAEGEEVAIDFVDDGPGIPDMEVEVLKEETVETAVHHGDGLGLWMVYLVVQRSGGSLQFDAGDDGTRVTVRLSRTATE